MSKLLTLTTNSAIKTPYQEAITRIAKEGLDYREIEDYEEMIKNLGGIKTIGERLKRASNDGSLRDEVINVFCEMWECLETGFTKSEIREAVGRLAGFDSDWIIPIEELEGIENTYLFNQTKGPTDAFKDIALQIITKLVSIIVQKKNAKNSSQALDIKKEYDQNKKEGESIIEYIKRNNLERPKLTFIINQVSTTGDTAPAAGEGIKNEPFTLLIMGYPINESTFAQIQQMLKLDAEAGNVIAQAFIKSFTHIQNKMKEGNTQEYQNSLKQDLKDGLKSIIEKYGFEIEVDAGTFNSINQARVDAQTNYHTVGHAQAIARNIIKPQDKLIEAIPSGNGGHMLSALFARLASGVKGATVISCNENDMFYNMLVKGIFKKPEESSEAVASPSVSMVIQEPNNIERLFRYMFGPKRAKEIREKYQRYEEVKLTEEELNQIKNVHNIHVEVVSSSEELETIYDTYKETGRLICPHTANAMYGLKKYREANQDNSKALVSETASPWKFLAAIAAGLSGKKGNEAVELYKEYQKIQTTQEGNKQLLSIIKENIEKLGGEFNREMIPEGLRELFDEPYEQKKALEPEKWPEITTQAVRSTLKMFNSQVDDLLSNTKSAKTELSQIREQISALDEQIIEELRNINPLLCNREALDTVITAILEKSLEDDNFNFQYQRFNRLLELMRQRFTLAPEIGRVKKILGEDALQNGRWEEVKKDTIEKAKQEGINIAFVDTLWEGIHKIMLEKEEEVM